MLPERGDNPILSYKCPNQKEPGGDQCLGILVFRPGQMVTQCDDCGAWTGIGASGLVPTAAATNGATQGTAHMMQVRLGGQMYSRPTFLELSCMDEECYYRKELGRAAQLGAIIADANHHPCPMPRPEPVQEPLPEAADA